MRLSRAQHSHTGAPERAATLRCWTVSNMVTQITNEKQPREMLNE